MAKEIGSYAKVEVKVETMECIAFIGTGVICPHCRCGMEWVDEEYQRGNMILRCAMVRCPNNGKLWQFPKVILTPFVK